MALLCHEQFNPIVQCRAVVFQDHCTFFACKKTTTPPKGSGRSHRGSRSSNLLLSSLPIQMEGQVGAIACDIACDRDRHDRTVFPRRDLRILGTKLLGCLALHLNFQCDVRNRFCHREVSLDMQFLDMLHFQEGQCIAPQVVRQRHWHTNLQIDTHDGSFKDPPLSLLFLQEKRERDRSADILIILNKMSIIFSITPAICAMAF